MNGRIYSRNPSPSWKQLACQEVIFSMYLPKFHHVCGWKYVLIHPIKSEINPKRFMHFIFDKTFTDEVFVATEFAKPFTDDTFVATEFGRNLDLWCAAKSLLPLQETCGTNPNGLGFHGKRSMDFFFMGLGLSSCFADLGFTSWA